MMEFHGRHETERYWYLREHLCNTCGEPASFKECARAHEALFAKIKEAPYMHPDKRTIIDLDKSAVS